MTRSLNTIISRLAIHDMRIEASKTFVKQIDDCIETISSQIIVENNGMPKVRRDYLTAAKTPLQERLDHLRIELQALALEISLKQKIAQSQLEIVSFYDRSY